MKIKFPDETIKEFSGDLSQVKLQIWKSEKIPPENQLIFMNDQLISNQNLIVDYNNIFNLVIRVLEHYMLCSSSMEKTIREYGWVAMVPPDSLVNTRDVESIKYPPRFYDVREVYKQNLDHIRKIKNDVHPFYTAYFQHEIFRKKELLRLRNHLLPGPVVVTTFNKPYLPLFYNFIKSCEAHNINIRNHLLVFPMDEDVAHACEQLKIHSFFKESSYGPTTSTHGQYGDDDFRICMFMKNAVVKDMLDLDFEILFQDIDMVWFKNPLPFLEMHGRINQYDFQFMFDGLNARFQPLYYNSGFFYIRSNDFSRKAWDTIFGNFDKVWQYGSQQIPVNIVMNAYREKGLRTHRLDEELFLNGHTITTEEHGITTITDKTMVVHVSWTESLEFKIQKLKNNGLWFIE